MRRAKRAMALMAALVAMPAGAQLLGGGGLGGGGLGGLGGGLTNMGQGLGQTLGDAPLVGGGGRAVAGSIADLGGSLSSVTQSLSPADLLAARRERLRALVHDNRAVLDSDADGNPVRRDEVIATGASDAALAAAAKAGFTVTRRATIDGLGLSAIVLAPPKGMAARKALAAIQALDPAGSYTLDHVYEPAFAALAPAGGKAAAGHAGAAPIGLIDGGIGAHPAFAGATIEQRGFAGEVKPSGHGTAVASLIVGQAGAFHGVVPGARLLAADVYGGSAANGSALAIVQAIGWLTARGVRVINISLVGAPDPLLAAGVRAAQAKGVLIVAAVGNDGPAAPPQYPASYEGVVAVTAVDGKGRVLLEAGRATHLDFAAPGADMAGAVPGGKWEVLRGTSFAAPLVAASLARRGSVEALASEAKPGGRTGRGIVCGECAIPPRAVGLR